MKQLSFPGMGMRQLQEAKETDALREKQALDHSAWILPYSRQSKLASEPAVLSSPPGSTTESPPSKSHALRKLQFTWASKGKLGELPLLSL